MIIDGAEIEDQPHINFIFSKKNKTIFYEMQILIRNL